MADNVRAVTTAGSREAFGLVKSQNLCNSLKPPPADFNALLPTPLQQTHIESQSSSPIVFSITLLST